MINILRKHFISKARTRIVSVFLNVHVSAAYIRTLITHRPEYGYLWIYQ